MTQALMLTLQTSNAEHHEADKQMQAVADQGFPVGEGADPLDEAPTYDFVKFSEKLHEIEKILGHRGARAGCVPPKSATGRDSQCNI